jgi:hypothetical protein
LLNEEDNNLSVQLSMCSVAYAPKFLGVLSFGCASLKTIQAKNLIIEISETILAIVFSYCNTIILVKLNKII